MAGREPRWNERYNLSGVIGILLYFAALAGIVAWAALLEKPYPCSGRRNCSAQVVR